MTERVAIITGATGVTGQAVAQALAAQGARLALLSANPEKLVTLAGQLALPAGQAITYAADLSDPAAIALAAGVVRVLR
jgi:NAD(P)-dependent dehydrogenase (short-subunit alcohol dehydrogenase family)